MAATGKVGAGAPDHQTTPSSAPARPVLTSVAWQPQSELSLAEWLAHGHRLGVMGRSVGWWIGDWLRYGNVTYGERYVRAARVTGYDVQTLMNMVYVASHIESSRRRENLSWSHHAEVAALPPAAQDRWLVHAETERLSVRCLREEIRRERRVLEQIEDPSADPGGDAQEPKVVCPSCGHNFPAQVDGVHTTAVA
jgi:hypothetical protein